MRKLLLLTLSLFLFHIEAKSMPMYDNVPMIIHKVSQLGKGKVNLYPNPAKDYFAIQIQTNSSIKEISIYTLIGNVLTKKRYNENTVNKNFQFNISNFKKGKYLVRVVFADGSSEVKALIKQ